MLYAIDRSAGVLEYFGVVTYVSFAVTSVLLTQSVCKWSASGRNHCFTFWCGSVNTSHFLLQGKARHFCEISIEGVVRELWLPKSRETGSCPLGPSSRGPRYLRALFEIWLSAFVRRLVELRPRCLLHEKHLQRPWTCAHLPTTSEGDHWRDYCNHPTRKWTAMK